MFVASSHKRGVPEKDLVQSRRSCRDCGLHRFARVVDDAAAPRSTASPRPSMRRGLDWFGSWKRSVDQPDSAGQVGAVSCLEMSTIEPAEIAALLNEVFGAQPQLCIEALSVRLRCTPRRSLSGPCPGAQKARQLAGFRVCGWSGRRGSNSRPPPWQGGALPLSYFRPLPGEYTTGTLAANASVAQ